MNQVYFIHRWHLCEETALLLEAALIDAYPDLANQVSGHHSKKYGQISPEELSALLSKDEIKFEEPVLLVDITRTFARKNPKRADEYDAARWAWPIDKSRASKCKYVLAHRDGLVVAIFKPEKWADVNPKNFPDISPAMKNAYKLWKRPKAGFTGTRITDEGILVSRLSIAAQ